MSALEAVGIAGSEHLREALTNCSDPLAAIEEFQVQNGILLPSLRPALPFLDLHDVGRQEFHHSVREELRDRMLQRIHEIGNSNNKNKLKMLNDLLVKSFPMVKVKPLQPVVMAVMQHLPKIKAEYLLAVVEDAELYAAASIEVKQQIWQDKQALFGDEVSPLLSKYIEDKENVLFDHTSPTSFNSYFFSPSPKARRQGEVCIQLTRMVGRNVKLYDMVLQFLRTLFLRTRNVHYCTLRAELLMSLHDLEIHEICSVDPCHKFTWCLDACIRERFVDAKRSRELQGFLDSVRRGQEQVLGDLAMILCDPFAVHTICTSIIRAMLQSAGSEGLPRANEDLILLMRMLALGQRAWTMIDSQVFREPKLESVLVTRFLPCLVGMMVDDQIKVLAQRYPDEPQPETEPIPELVSLFCRDSEVACTVLCNYALNAVRGKDVAAVGRVLPFLAECDLDIVYQDMMLHSLVSGLAGAVEHFSSNDLQEAINKFFMPYVSRETVLRQLLRLLWCVHPRLATGSLTELLAVLQPNNQHSVAVHSVYTALMGKVANYQPSPIAEPEKLDSPLASVPAPTPAPHRS